MGHGRHTLRSVSNKKCIVTLYRHVHNYTSTVHLRILLNNYRSIEPEQTDWNQAYQRNSCPWDRSDYKI